MSKYKYTLDKKEMKRILYRTQKDMIEMDRSFHLAFIDILYKQHRALWMDVMNSNTYRELFKDEVCFNLITELTDDR